MLNMRVLFLTNIPSPNRVAFFNELGKQCDLTVTFELLSSSERDKNWVGEKIDYFKPIFLNGIQTAVDAAFCPGILKCIKKGWDYIIVGTYNTPTSMLATQYMMLKKIPYWLEADGGFIKKDNKVKYLLKKHFISNASRWLSTSEMTTKYLCHYGAKKEKCFVFPFTSLRENEIIKNGMPMDVDKKMAKEELGIKDDFAIIIIGEYLNNKIYEQDFGMFESLAERKRERIGIYILGGESTEEIKKEVFKGDFRNVHYIVCESKEEVDQYFIAGDVFVFNSRSDLLKGCIIEAMAAALPIVTTNKSLSGNDWVDEGINGHIIGDDEPELVIKYIDEFINNSEKRKQYSLESYKKMINTSLENISDEYLSVMIGVQRQLKKYARERLGISNEFVFLFVGQIVYRKGIDILIEAAYRVNYGNWKIYVVGGLEPKDTDYDRDKITFCGFKYGADLIEYYRMADVFILPTREDIWGLVINEAMSHGLPIITTDKCIAGIELCEKDSRIIKSDNVDELVDAMDYYIQYDKGELDKFRNMSVRKSMEYTLERMAEEHIRILQK